MNNFNFISVSVENFAFSSLYLYNLWLFAEKKRDGEKESNSTGNFLK